MKKHSYINHQCLKKPGYQEFKPHTAKLNAAAYNILQGLIFLLSEGWIKT